MSGNKLDIANCQLLIANPVVLFDNPYSVRYSIIQTLFRCYNIPRAGEATPDRLSPKKSRSNR